MRRNADNPCRTKCCSKGKRGLAAGETPSHHSHHITGASPSELIPREVSVHRRLSSGSPWASTLPARSRIRQSPPLDLDAGRAPPSADRARGSW